jgi:glucose-1-phosphate thymidylyltransferase
VGVIPAAGHARRLQPLDGSKELVQVGGRPVMDYLVDRMLAGGAHRIVVVTRPDKQDVAGHAAELGLEVVEGTPETVSASLLLGVQRAQVKEADICLLGFPDTLWEPADGFARLTERLEADVDAVLGIFESPEPERSDVVSLDGDRVRSVEIKPRRPRSAAIWGCAAARTAALDGLRSHDEPGQLFGELAGSGRVAAVRLSGAMTDIGTEEALVRARSVLGS